MQKGVLCLVKFFEIARYTIIFMLIPLNIPSCTEAHLSVDDAWILCESPLTSIAPSHATFSTHTIVIFTIYIAHVTCILIDDVIIRVVTSNCIKETIHIL